MRIDEGHGDKIVDFRDVPAGNLSTTDRDLSLAPLQADGGCAAVGNGSARCSAKTDEFRPPDSVLRART